MSRRKWRCNALRLKSGDDENGPMPLAELKTYITPTAAELKKATEGKGLGDPAVPLEEQKEAIDDLGANYTFQDLEQCLPEKGHPAMLTIRRAGNGAGGRGKPTGEKNGPDCANKPTHTGSECKTRGPPRKNFNTPNRKQRRSAPRGKQNSRPRYNNNMKSNNSRDPRKARVVGNKPAAFVVKPTLGKHEEIDDAWAGLSVEAMINEKPECGKIAVEELYKLPPEPIKVANPLASYTNYAIKPCQMTDVDKQNKTKEAPIPQLPAKKNKTEELPKLKRCKRTGEQGGAQER
eukprot:g3262.t1